MACSDNKFFIKISTHLLIMEVDFCPVLCIPEVPFKIKASQNLHKIISTHLLIMEVDFCPALCIPKVAVLQAFWGISHFVWYCKAVSDLS